MKNECSIRVLSRDFFFPLFILFMALECEKCLSKQKTSQITNNHFNRFHSFSKQRFGLVFSFFYFFTIRSLPSSPSIVNLNARPRKAKATTSMGEATVYRVTVDFKIEWMSGARGLEMSAIKDLGVVDLLESILWFATHR